MSLFPTYADKIALDFESTGLKTWLPNFRVISAAFCWKNPEGQYEFAYQTGEDNILPYLKALIGRTAIIQNVSYEMQCIQSRWPEFWKEAEFGIHWVDCARLVQNWDGGGVDYDDGEKATFGGKTKSKKNPNTGFKLEALAARVLPSHYHNHKQPYYEWIRKNIPDVKKKKEGAHLSKLPPDMLKRYNEMDVEITYEIYLEMCKKFDSEGFNWNLDHNLYAQCCRYLSSACNFGVKVNRQQLSQNMEIVKAEIDEIKTSFMSKFPKEIEAVEIITRARLRDTYKSEKGRADIETNPKKVAKWKFKVTSTRHLKLLFVDILNMKYEFKTPKGGPSFKAAFLSQWGEGGLLLEKRGKRQLVLNQMISLYNLSEDDGRWHWSMKSLGTKTSRLAGGNV